MAIALDAAADAGNNSGLTSSLSYGGFTNAGSVMFIVVVGDIPGGADDVIAPTWNGVSATLLNKDSNVSNRIAYFYILQNPAIGNKTLQVTASSTHYLFMGVATYSGAATSGQPDAHNVTDSGAATTTLTSSLTTSADNCWVVMASTGYSDNNPPTAGTGATFRAGEGAFGSWGLFDTNGVVHPAGSKSMTANRAVATQYMANFMTSIAPPGAGGGFNAGWAKATHMIGGAF